MTRTGQSVQVTDNGEPLWILQPAVTDADEAERRRRSMRSWRKCFARSRRTSARPNSWKNHAGENLRRQQLCPSIGHWRGGVAPRHCRSIACLLPKLFFLPLHALEVRNAILQRAFHQRRSTPSGGRQHIARARDAALARLEHLVARRALIEVTLAAQKRQPLARPHFPPRTPNEWSARDRPPSRRHGPDAGY